MISTCSPRCAFSRAWLNSSSVPEPARCVGEPKRVHIMPIKMSYSSPSCRFMTSCASWPNPGRECCSQRRSSTRMLEPRRLTFRSSMTSCATSRSAETSLGDASRICRVVGFVGMSGSILHARSRQGKLSGPIDAKPCGAGSCEGGCGVPPLAGWTHGPPPPEGRAATRPRGRTWRRPPSHPATSVHVRDRRPSSMPATTIAAG